MVSNHRIRTETGGISQHGGPPDYQKFLVGGPIAVGSTPTLGRLWGGGVERGGGVNHLESEYGCAIHCDSPKSGNIHGGRAEDRVTGNKTVVVTGRYKLHGGAGGGGIDGIYPFSITTK